MPSCTSPAVSFRTLPISRVIAREISSLRVARISPARRITSPRNGAGVRRQTSNPRFADSTARSRSSAFDRGQDPITSFGSAGLRFSKYSPLAGATHSPAIRFLCCLLMAGNCRSEEALATGSGVFSHEVVPLDFLVQVGARHVDGAGGFAHIPVVLAKFGEDVCPLGALFEIGKRLGVEEVSAGNRGRARRA